MLKNPKEAGINTMSAMHIIELINSNYDSIHLDYIKTSHDTIYVHIPNSEMLTERIGSTGALQPSRTLHNRLSGNSAMSM
jgi:hypothetical protein